MEKLEKNLFKITWPLFIESLFFMLFGLVDTLMLSRYSDLSIGSVGISNQILFLTGTIINVAGIGIGVVASQYLGAKRIQEAKDTIVTGIVTNLAIGVLIATTLFFFNAQILSLMGTDQKLFDEAAIYLKITGLSVFFVAFRVSVSSGFRSFSKPKVIMYIMIVGNVINIILNAILIYGLFGAPRLGVTGAALGTLISRIVVMIIASIATYKILHIKLHKIRLHLIQLQKIFYIGIPSAIENFLWSFAQVVIVYFLNRISVEAVIARTYIYTILSFIFIFSNAVASGNAIIVGYYIGEEDHHEAYRHTMKALRIAFALVIAVTGLLNIFARPIIGLFTDDDLIIQMSRNVLYIAVLIELGRSMNLVFIYALRAAGDAIFPVIIGAISMYGIAVFFSYLLGVHLGMGILGVFIAAMLDEVIRGMIMGIRWMRKKWMTIDLIKEGT